MITKIYLETGCLKLKELLKIGQDIVGLNEEVEEFVYERIILVNKEENRIKYTITDYQKGEKRELRSTPNSPHYHIKS